MSLLAVQTVGVSLRGLFYCLDSINCNNDSQRGGYYELQHLITSLCNRFRVDSCAQLLTLCGFGLSLNHGFIITYSREYVNSFDGKILHKYCCEYLYILHTCVSMCLRGIIVSGGGRNE